MNINGVYMTDKKFQGSAEYRVLLKDDQGREIEAECSFSFSEDILETDDDGRPSITVDTDIMENGNSIGTLTAQLKGECYDSINEYEPESDRDLAYDNYKVSTSDTAIVLNEGYSVDDAYGDGIEEITTSLTVQHDPSFDED